MPTRRNVPKPPVRAVRRGSRILKGAPPAGGGGGGAVTIRGTPGTDGDGATITATSRTPPITSGTQPGELMVAAIAFNFSGGATLTGPPSGWTLLHNTTQTNDTLAVYYRYFQAGDANPTFTISVAAACVAVCITFSGAVTSGAPVAANLLGGSGSTTAHWAAITPANANDLLVFLNGIRPGTAGVVPTVTTPSGGTGGAVTQTVYSTNISGSAEEAIAFCTQQLTAATAVAQQDITSGISTSASCNCEALCIAAAAAGQVTFDAVGPAGGGGASTAGAGPLTWAHINSNANNAILVGVNYRSGTSPEATAVTYGGVALSRLGTVPGNNAGPGGADLWGKIGGLPTGSNTVSVTFTGGAGNATTGGSVSLTGAASFGTAVTAFASGGSVSANVTGTTSGGMIAAVASYGNSLVFSTTSPGTQRWAVNGDSSSAADNTVGGTWVSPGGTQAVGFSNSNTTDWWGLVAVEVLAAAGGAQAGAATLSGSGTLGAAPYFDPAPVTMSGLGTLAAAPVFASAAALSGTGTLTAGPNFAGSAVLSGAGTLSATTIMLSSATLSGLGSLTAAPVLAGGATLSGTGTLGAAPYLSVPGALSGSGTLTGLWTGRWVSALSGVGTLSASPVFTGAATLSGSGSLSASPAFTGSAVLSGSGTLSATPVYAGAATLTGSGTLSATLATPGAATLTGSGTLTASPVFSGATALSGLGTLSGAPALATVPVFAGTGTLTGAPLRPAAATLTGSGTLSGAWTLLIQALLSGTGTLSGGGAPGATLTGLGSLTAAPAFTPTALLSGAGTLQASPLFSGAGLLSGLGTLAGLPVFRPSALLTGSGTLQATAAFAGTVSLAGQGTLTAVSRFTGASTLTGQGSLTAVTIYGTQAVFAGLGTLSATPFIPAIGDTGTVTWTAHPGELRFRALPGLPRWAAGVLSARWKITVTGPRWAAGPAPARWSVDMTVFEPISALSLEKINVVWTSDLDGTVIDPTTTPLVVQMAFPVSSGDVAHPSQPSAWFAGSWLAGGTGKGFVAQCSVGPGGAVTLIAGQHYDVWSKILGSPEQPVKFAGVLPVY